MENFEVLYKLFLGGAFGALIGIERSFFKKQAGLRTFALVGLGATLFSVLATHFGIEGSSRILSNIVVGIGFIGAGLIFYHSEKLTGVTTASALWITAAIGASVGQGLYLESFFVTIFTIIILTVLPFFEEKICQNEISRNEISREE
ncbi:MAG: MgtC/SapB family protein [Patescibacteria group bacterium]